MTNDWRENVIKAAMSHEKQNYVDEVITAVLDKVFERLHILAKGELEKAKELLDMVKETAPFTRIDRDLDSLAGLTRKAMLRQKVGHAYLWAIQDIKTVLDLPIDETEFMEAIHNHPTERTE